MRRDIPAMLLGAMTLGTSLLALGMVTFPDVAITWTTQQQWFTFGVIVVGISTGAALLLAGSKEVR